MDVAIFRGELAERLIAKKTDEENLAWLCGFGIDLGSAQSIISYFKEQLSSCGFIPNEKELAIEGYLDISGNHNLIFHFPFGRRVNDALSRAYALLITQQMGCNVSVSITDDSFMITSPKRIEIKGIEKILTSGMLEDVLMRAIKDSELFKQRFRHTAARSFMILRNYKGREVSVGRQQVRSSFLLDALSNMEGVPVIDETYREITEDVMDIKNAKGILELLETGKVTVRTIDYSSTPTPFAHNAILAGISDMVLMEDRGALLRELHRRVLSKVMGADISEFEFTEDKVVPYFRQRIGFVSNKDELLSLVHRAGPIRVLKERGRNVYPYAVVDRATVDRWAEELIKDRAISSVYIDDAYFVETTDLPVYASALTKERELDNADTVVLEALNKEMSPTEISEATDLPNDRVHQSLRRLEAAALIGRSAHREGKWYYKQTKIEKRPRQEALDEVLMRYLECFAPGTAEEIAYALGLPEKEVRTTLSDLEREGMVSEGKFLVSEHVQYMLRRDYLRLKTNDLSAYDHRTVEEYRRQKQNGPFDSIDACLDLFGDMGMPLDVFYRVDGFDIKDWERMRRSGDLLLGRFLHGKVRYVRSMDAPAYVAAYRNAALKPLDLRILAMIKGSEGMSLRQLVSELSLPKDDIKESIDRLDRNMYIVRRYEEREEWSSENVYLRL